MAKKSRNRIPEEAREPLTGAQDFFAELATTVFDIGEVIELGKETGKNKKTEFIDGPVVGEEGLQSQGESVEIKAHDNKPKEKVEPKKDDDQTQK